MMKLAPPNSEVRQSARQQLYCDGKTADAGIVMVNLPPG
jgi:hypothetical protein